MSDQWHYIVEFEAGGFSHLLLDDFSSIGEIHAGSFDTGIKAIYFTKEPDLRFGEPERVGKE